MKKILIVEDDLLQVFFLNRVMTFLGHEVIGNSGNGASAIEMATELNPDIILMDINLEDELDGVTTAAQILKKVDDCFIIYITANSYENLINQAKETQPSTFLFKPVTVEMIKNSIDSYFSVLG